MVKEASDKYIRWLSELSKDDVSLVGGKGANLGEMYNSGMPVPPAFVITTQAYKLFLDETGLDEKISEKLKELDEENTEKLEKITKQIRQMIEAEEIPKEIEEEVLEAYENISFDKSVLRGASEDAKAILSRGFELGFVAVRSSATAEDTAETSFAGQNQTFLNIKGKMNLLKAVKACWASLFTARSVYYQIKNKLIDKKILISVIIQQMVNADKSGVIFSRDPVKQDENIVLEAVFGLGEGIVSGKIKPDNYIVNRDMKIISTKIADKKIALIRNSSGNTEEVKLTDERSKSQVLTNYEIKKLADYAIQLEEHYKKAQDIEFAIDAGVIYIVQTRPVTTLGKVVGKEKKEVKGELILQGLGASPGVASGKVKVIHNLNELSKIVKGDVLVTKMTNPDMVVSMQKAAAIVTDEGGLTAHAAIVSREMGIPAVVGTQEATEILKDGMEVTVDGSSGKVYLGKVLEEKKIEIKPAIETKTKIKVMVDIPSSAERASKTGLKEVGLTRIEGIIAEAGKHPYLFEKENKLGEYEEVIFSGISRIAKYFDKLWVRTSDIRSDEYMDLPGAPEKEANPMLGLHGIRDSLLHLGILKAELLALKKLAEHKKIGILMPQIISVDEVRKVKKILDELEFAELELGVMVETPAAVEIIEELCEEGIDFISFGTNDLTQYTLAIDRGNEEVQFLFDEMNPAVLHQLEKVIKVCKIYGVETSICGQAGSKKEMAEFLVKQGIDSISVNADKAEEISRFVAELEEKGLRGSELESKEEELAKEEVEQEEEQEETGEEEQVEKLTKEEYVEPDEKRIEDKKLTEKDKEEKQAEKIQEKIKEEIEEEEKEAEETIEKLKEEEKKEIEELKEEFPEFESNIDIFNPAGTERDKEKTSLFDDKKGELILEEGEKEIKEVEEDEEEKEETKGKYDIICSLCGNEDNVPFKPDKRREIFCKACYKLGRKGREKLKETQPPGEAEKEIEKSAKEIEEMEAEQVEGHFYVDDSLDIFNP